MNRVVLRRRSWPIFCRIALLGLGVGMFFAVRTGEFRTGWQGIPVYLAIAGILGRIANCKLVLRDDALLVVNPLRTHVVPRAMIHGVSVGDDGTLEVHLDRDRTISVYAFGGSLVDHFKGTSSEAERKIIGWLNSGHAVSDAKGAPQARWTRCAPADLSLILCVAISVAGAIWMKITSS